ncbi:MAG TPA: hypothetical protein ENI92_07070 [Bacteroidetes bacterium]|nr:hypothetical protein [Bacteroidota bacterium]
MPMVSFALRDLVWFGVLLVSLALAYGRLRAEIRHLEDTKAEQRDLGRLSDELRGMLTEIRTAIARLEEALRGGGKAGQGVP